MRTLVILLLLCISQIAQASHYVEFIIFKQDSIYQPTWQHNADKKIYLVPEIHKKLMGASEYNMAQTIVSTSLEVNHLDTSKLLVQQKEDTVLISYLALAEESSKLQQVVFAGLSESLNITTLIFNNATTAKTDTVTRLPNHVVMFTSKPQALSKKTIQVIEEIPASSFFQQTETLLFGLILLMVIFTFILIFKRIKA